MSASRNKQLVLDYLRAVSEGRRGDAYACFAPDASWQRPPSLGGSGRFEGRDAIFDVYFAVDEELFETGTREYDFEVRTAIAEGDHVAVEMRHRGRGANGQPYETDYHVLFVVRDGLIEAVREYYDSLYMQRVFLDDRSSG